MYIFTADILCIYKNKKGKLKIIITVRLFIEGPVTSSSR